MSFVIGCSDVWLSIHPKPEKVVQNELRNYVSGEPPLDATTCPSGCTSTAGACACPVQLDQQVLPGLCEVASMTWISGPSVVSPFHLFDCDVALAKRQDGMHVIRAGGAVLQNPPVFMDRKAAA